MTSIYYLITEKYKEQKEAEQLFEILNGITANEYGEGIFCELRDSPEFSEYDKLAIVKYIAYAYSKDSELIVYGAASITQKNGIAAKVGLPDTLHTAVIMLGSPVVRSLIEKYLDFQGERDYKYLESKKHTYESLQKASVNDVKKEDGSTNYKLLVEIQDLMDRLLKEIDLLEDSLRQRFGHVALVNKEELKKAGEHGAPPSSLAIEESPTVNNMNGNISK